MSQTNAPSTPPAKEPNPSDISRAAREGLEDIIALNNLNSAIVSPATVKRAQFILERWESASKDSEIFVALASEMHRRVLVDTKYAEALKRVEELKVIEFKLRYGDYLASSLQELQRSSRRLRAAAPDSAINLGNAPNEAFSLPQVQEEALAFFKTHQWSEILSRLHSEKGMMEPHRFVEGGAIEGSPILHLIQVLAGLNETTAAAIITTIEAYVSRNGTAHSRIAEYAAQRKTLLLAQTIEKDLQDLKSAPAACQEAVPAIRDAIWKTIHKRFAVFEWSEEHEQCLGYLMRDKS
ncbi:hypothetical protein TgHK011_001998 [Trichoderma gracile]|nr:hypothetical protein TgHK011_001998 [Trichoderma gracile]